MTTGQIIKVKRTELGLTQEELAKTFTPPLSRNTIIRWERGHTEKMRASHIAHLCNLFNLQPSELIGGTLEAEAVMELYKKADTDIKEIVKKLLKYYENK